MFDPSPISRITIPARTLTRILLALAVLPLLFPAHGARADIAPPANPPGANPHPGDEPTQVRMLAESVLIDVLGYIPADSLGQARVSAEFHMQNLGGSAETLEVRFPISANDGFFRYPEIEDLQVSVDGRPVTTRRQTLPDPEFDDPIQWAAFTVTFPPGQEVVIMVTYTLGGTGEYPFVSYAYLLETGAGWSGTIGRADLTVRLPYEVSPQNVFIDSSPGWGWTSPGAVLSGREIRWLFQDLEPTAADNLSVALVNPYVWGRVLVEQGYVAADPTDGEAWGQLGKLYKETSLLRRGVRDDAGGLQLYDLSVEAYEQAVRLLPDDALWHAGFGDLLFARYYYEEFIAGRPEMPNLQRAIREFHLAYTLAPDNTQIQDMLIEVSVALPEAVERPGDEYVFLWITATPTPRPPTATATPTVQPPTPTATATAALPPSATLPPASPTAMAVAQATSGPTTPPEKTPSGASRSPQLCGAALAFPLFLSVVLVAASIPGRWRA